MGDCQARFCERFRGEIPLYLLDSYSNIRKRAATVSYIEISSLDFMCDIHNPSPTKSSQFNLNKLSRSMILVQFLYREFVI